MHLQENEQQDQRSQCLRAKKKISEKNSFLSWFCAFGCSSSLLNFCLRFASSNSVLSSPSLCKSAAVVNNRIVLPLRVNERRREERKQKKAEQKARERNQRKMKMCATRYQKMQNEPTSIFVDLFLSIHKLVKSGLSVRNNCDDSERN